MWEKLRARRGARNGVRHGAGAGAGALPHQVRAHPAVANPKNLVLAIGGAVSIAGSGASAGGKTVATVLMVLIGSLCALVPLAVYLVGGAKSGEVLTSWKAWMAHHNAAIMTTLLVVLGAKYVGDALSGLAA